MSKVQLNAVILMALFLATLAGVKSAKPLTREGRPNTDFSRIPMEFDGWIGTRGRFPESTYRALPSSSLLIRTYLREGYANPVELAIVYGTNIGDFHQPEVCLEGQGYPAVEKKGIRIAPSGRSPFSAVSLITQGDEERRAFIYWFYSRGATSTFLGQYKLKILKDRLAGKRIEPSAMIRLSSTVFDTDEEATARLERFAREVFPYLEKEFPTTGAATTEKR